MPEISKPIPTAKEIKEMQMMIYAKCVNNPLYFIQKFVYIQTDGKRELFVLYEFQKKLLAVIHKHDKAIILKSRQLGITTLCAAYTLWLMIFHSDQSILALAPDKDKAQKIIEKLRLAYDMLPQWMIAMAKAEHDKHNTTSLKLKNGSMASAVSGVSKSSRSFTANFLILDEAAFIEHAEELWGSAQQTMGSITNPKCVIMSTPNGYDGFFDEMWKKAENQDINFVPIKLPWQVHPKHDQKWRDEQDKEAGKRLAAQECDCSFLTSGDTFFTPEDLQFIEEGILPPVEKSGPNNAFWIWNYAEENVTYMAIVDTSRGDGLDNSAIQVIDIFSGDQVAEYCGDLSPKQLAAFAIQICMQYNDALLIIENTGIGQSTIGDAINPEIILNTLEEDVKEGSTASEVLKMGYPNIFYSPKGASTNVSEYLKKDFSNDSSKMTAGFTTSLKTRPLILNTLRDYISNKLIRIRSSRFYSEATTFIWKNGKAQAQNSRTDDLIISYAIGMFLRDSAIQYRTKGIELQKAALSAIKKNTVSMGYNRPSNVNLSSLSSSNESNNINYLKNNPYQLKIAGNNYDISEFI